MERERKRERQGQADDVICSWNMEGRGSRWGPPLTLTTPPSLTFLPLVGPAHCSSGLYCGWDPAIPKAFVGVRAWLAVSAKVSHNDDVPGQVDPTTHPLELTIFIFFLHVHLLVAGLVPEGVGAFLSLFIYCESWCPYLLTSEVSFTEWSH